jgi:hypothetical protein
VAEQQSQARAALTGARAQACKTGKSLRPHGECPSRAHGSVTSMTRATHIVPPWEMRAGRCRGKLAGPYDSLEDSSAKLCLLHRLLARSNDGHASSREHCSSYGDCSGSPLGFRHYASGCISAQSSLHHHPRPTRYPFALLSTFSSGPSCSNLSRAFFLQACPMSITPESTEVACTRAAILRPANVSSLTLRRLRMAAGTLV